MLGATFGMAKRPQADHERLIGELYDAAVDPEDRTTIAIKLGELAAGHAAAVCIFGPEHYEAITDGIPEEARRIYETYFHTVDPWTNHAKAHAEAGRYPASIGRRIIPERELLRTEYFAGFARRFDLIEVIGGSVPLGHGRVAVFSTHRPWRGRRFDAREEARIQRFTPHLQRALQLREHLIGDTQALGFAALDRLAFGTVVCDASGLVLFANAAAEQVARSGQGIELGDAATPVGAIHGGDTQRLLAMVRDVCTGGAGGSMALPGRGGTKLLVLIAPLPRRFGLGPPLALLAMRPAVARATVDAGVLADLFGLTPAEAALTTALAAGTSLTEIGAQRGTSENTLRTQLGNIFRKTGTRNQSDLVRLIALLPPLR